MSFFEPGYTIPKESRYMKFEEGENTFRILGSFTRGTAIKGLEYWKTIDGKRKPIRVHMDVKVPLSELEENPNTGELDSPKHFWAFPVWNYAEKKVQILEIKQKGIMQAILSLSKNSKWGDPNEYDLVVTKIKDQNKTSYTTMPNPKSEVPSEAIRQLNESPITIEALFEGKDPFAQLEKDSFDLADEVERETKKKGIK